MPMKKTIRTSEERNKLIELLLPPNQNWVESIIIRKYKKARTNPEFREELLSVGYEALVHAGDIWEEEYGEDGRSKFFIFAQNQVRSALRIAALSYHKAPLYIPHGVQEEDHQEFKKWLQEDNEDPSPDSQGIRVPLDWVEDNPIIIEESTDPETESMVQERNEILLQSMDEVLTPREQEVLSLSFGLEEKRKTFAAIGEKMGLSPQRIYQLKNEALQKLRKFYTSRGLDANIE